MSANLRKESLSRGLLGGSKTWMVIGVVVWSAKALQWAWKRDVGVVTIQELEPGAQYVISQRLPADRRKKSR